ncbi:prominin-1-A isoform X1 [Vanessa atalanta]|uniref:prominin-1-A isoform X1 n=1 Tax=Vanessa atalanta TaxID=42275 RepID=UPI001FCD2A54|nr:prominin-1-A isoform X1 [Vanessa atalanta]
MNKKSVLALVLIILETNLVISRTNCDLPTEVKTLEPSGFASVFALQIQQIRSTSEETPVVSTGSNLNVFDTNVPSNSLDVQEENFRAISTLHPIEETNVGEKMRNDRDGGNSESLLSNRNFQDGKKSELEGDKVYNSKDSLNLVWDNCFENVYRDNTDTTNINAKSYTDIETPRNIETENIKSYRNILNKRNSLNVSGTSALNSWLEKFNIFRTASNEEPDIPTKDILLSPTTLELSTSSSTQNTIPFIPITKDILREFTGPLNITLDVVTENTINYIKGTKRDDFYVEITKDRSNIKFSSLPQKQTYLIPKFKLEEGFYPFTFMSKFFSVIYLFDYPIGLVKEIVNGKATFPYSFLKSIRVESSFLVFIIIFGIFALIIPLYLFILSLISLFSKSKCTDEIESGTLFLEPERGDCHSKILVIFTFLFLLISCFLITGMVLSNEQSRMAVAESRNIISCACADIASWLSTAAQELHHSLVPPVDMVYYAYKEDLREAETLLGQPIQQAIASESGIDLVLDSLADIITESEDLSMKVSSLRDICHKAGLLAIATSDKIKDLAQQLDSLKRNCAERDAPLCDTLNTNSLHITMKFDSILQEHQLLELKDLGVINLTQAISAARKEFRTLPSAIYSQTELVRADILQDIENRRQSVHNSARVLSDIVRHLTSALHSLARQFDIGLDRVHKYDLWRWVILLTCNASLSFVMILVLFAMFCGCGNAKIHAKRTLQVSSFCICIISIILWSLICATFLIAGHAELYACQILWDTQQYKTLSLLLDKPSPLLSDNEGIFDVLFKDLDNVTIEVSVKNILRECEKNQPAYSVFQLEKILDVNKETSYFEWDELQDDLKRLSTTIDVGFLKTVSDSFNKFLNRILFVSDVNLTKYRMEFNGPVVGKDLPSFVDQLENVAVQVSDLNTAGRLETLATRTQRLHLSNIKPLEQLRTELVFKLTELELQMMPFRRKLNISLSHIHTAQFYIDNQGDVIAQKKLSIFVSRLIAHTAGWRTHAIDAVNEHAARCGPLFAVFAAIRTLLCTKYVSALNGWWLCGFLLGLVWCTVFTPLCVKLWRAYSKKLNTLETLSLASLGSLEHLQLHHVTTPIGPPQDLHRHLQTTVGDYTFTNMESGSDLDFNKGVDVNRMLPSSTKVYPKDYYY